MRENGEDKALYSYTARHQLSGIQLGGGRLQTSITYTAVVPGVMLSMMLHDILNNDIEVAATTTATATAAATTTTNENYIFFEAWLSDGNLHVGNRLTVEQALATVSKGKDVYTPNKSSAQALAIAASGGRTVCDPEQHGGGRPGYFQHFHPNPRNGSHIFFGFPST